jgi:allophanate hydrolase
MDFAAFGSFVALIPPPLGIGTVTLEDGGTVKSFVGETYAIAGSQDITEFGGWRNWLARAT